VTDLERSLEQADRLALAAHEAALAFADATQADVDRVTQAMAQAGHDNAERLAQIACEETGYGRVDHKTFKNRFCSLQYLERIRDVPTIGVIARYPERGVVEIAEPVGVVAGLVPVTNPTATTLFYALACVRARNAIVNAPHPRAVRCIGETVRVLEDAARAAGAPPNLITAMSEVTLDGTQELMRHYRTDLVLATGSRGMVLAAYSSGKPTYAVGPGNSPTYVHRSVRDAGEAVAGILASKTFDNGTACASEQAIVVDAAIAATVRRELEARGAYFPTADEQAKLAHLLFPGGPGSPFNVESVGQFATTIASMAGISVPAGTRALVVQPAGVGREHALSHELLCPVLKWYEAPTEEAAIQIAYDLLKYGGDGHTAAIHAEDESIVARYARVPAYRISVNGPTLFGSMGYTTGFEPSFMLGTGTIGGTISSDNIGPRHLVNVKRVGVAVRSWRDSGIGEDGFATPTAHRMLSAATPPPSGEENGSHPVLDAQPALPERQAALVADLSRTPAPPTASQQPSRPAGEAISQRISAAAPPPAPEPPRVPTKVAIDVEAVVREAIEEVISR